MIVENSGKIFLFKLNHNLGYGFAEVYDFSDLSWFSGRYIFVYNRIDQNVKITYDVENIRSSGIALGPITLYKLPNTRGVGAWKCIFKTEDFIINKLPITKAHRGLMLTDINWNIFPDWYKSDIDPKKEIQFMKYETVRHLETRILNSNLGVATKFSMKVLIDNNKNIWDYYDSEDIGDVNMFEQLINTYYPLTKAEKLLSQFEKLTKKNKKYVF